MHEQHRVWKQRRNNGGGICLNSSNNTLTENDITNNVDGITLFSYAHCNDIFANKVTANTNWGIYVWHCENNTLSGNAITKNDYGFYLSHCSNNTVSGNTVANNTNGIYLDGFSNNTLTENTVTKNDNGICFLFSSNNTLTENDITNNDYGIRIEGYSYWNSIYHNNFINNTQQTYIPAPIPTNSWDDGYPSGGNYWDDYNGTDIYSGLGQNVTGSDAIGDTAYNISTSNQDRYPLITTTISRVGPTTRFGVVWQGETYYVDVRSNSTIDNFEFKQSDKLMAFNVTGPPGTTGFCNITMPNNLLRGDPWTVLIDGSPPTPEHIVTSNTTHTFLYFTYSHSTKTVEIKGTQVIPEFPSFLIPPLFMIATLLTAIVYRRKHSK